MKPPSRRRSTRSTRALATAQRLAPLDAVLALFPALALLLGGASAGGFVANALLQLLAVLILAWTMLRLDWMPERKGDRVPLVFGFILVGIMLIQLIPLPPFLWTALPGRGTVIEGFAALGVDPLPWMPLSMTPARTLAAVTGLLPALAALAIVLQVSRPALHIALWSVFAMVALSVLLGIAQLSGGNDSPFYIYSITNFGDAVGFFANSNHFATLMVAAVPLVAGVATRARMRGDETGGTTIAWIAAPAIALIALLGVFAGGSLAGILLAPVAFGGSYLILRPTIRRRARMWLLLGAAAACAVTLAVVLLSPSAQDFGSTSFGNDDMSRPAIWRIAVQAVLDVMPFGSGYGSFPSMFHLFENPATVGVVYANHAHSDLIELLLEAGLIGAVLLAVFLYWFVRRSWIVWSGPGRDPIACAAAISIALILLHSLVDYPLRTAAISVLFALCCGILARSEHVQPVISAAPKPATKARHLSA